MEKEQNEAVEQEVVEQKPEYDQEKEQYSERVQRRINKLTGERRAESEARIAAENEVIRLRQETEDLRKQVQTSIPQDAFGDQLKARLESAKKNFSNAYDNGDKDGMVDAQLQIADITSDIKLLQHRPRAEAPRQQEQRRVEAPRQAPNPSAQEWAGRNKWFRNDDVMTAAAFVIDGKLTNEGYDPNDPSYFDELDKRMKEQFPHRFRDAPRKEVISGSDRGDRGNPSKKDISLNDEEKRIARVFGLTEDEYKDQKRRVDAAGGQALEVTVRRPK